MLSTAGRAILWAGLLAGILDLTAAFVSLGLRGRTPIRVLQSIASGLWGTAAYNGGLGTAVLGVILHFLIALTASAIYYAASRRLNVLRKQPVLFGLLYGIAVYLFMNLLVLPLSAFPHPVSLSIIGLLVIMFCVGLPIALMISGLNATRNKRSAIVINIAMAMTFLLTMTTTLGYAQLAGSRATFAGGCYWCMEEAFEMVHGVLSVTSGFHNDMEAVDIRFDSKEISYRKLLQVFWKNVDPTDAGGQFCDRGTKYRSGIFYHDEAQRNAALESKLETEKALNQPVATLVIEADLFSVAAEEDQDFYKRDPVRYKEYKTKCGRARRLEELQKEMR